MQDMRSDVDLLVHLTDECPVVVDRVLGNQVVLTAKVISRWTDRSLQTISDYRTGKTNIPVEFWRRILEHFLDMRIISLLVPDCLHVEVFTHEGKIESAPAFFRDAVAAEAAHCEQMKYIAEILADGRVDELDAATVQKFNDAYWGHRIRDIKLHHSILAEFNRQKQKAGAQ